MWQESGLAMKMQECTVLNITHQKHILKDEQNFENNAVAIPTVCSLAIIISNMAAVISVWGDMFQAVV